MAKEEPAQKEARPGPSGAAAPPSSPFLSSWAADWLLWQLADSGLPTGGFVASAGLEAAFQLGHVRDLAGVRDFVQASVRACAAGTLPFIAAAHRRAATEAAGSPAETVRDLMEFDNLYDASNPNTPLRRASRAQGMAMLTVYDKCFAGMLDVDRSTTEGRGEGSDLAQAVRLLKQSVRRGNASGHAPVCFGLVCAALNISRDQTFRLFLFLLVRSVISAAVRLGVVGVGPYSAQRLLASFQDFTESAVAQVEHQLAPIVSATTAAESLRVLSETAVQTAPLVDIWQGVHDRLFSKLFWT